MTPTKAFLAVSLLFSAALTGCTGGAPDDVLLITGQAAGTILLERRLDLPCWLDDFEPQPGAAPFELLAQATPDERGTYVFEVYRATARPSGDGQACFRVRQESAPRAEVRTELRSGDAHLPALLHWDEPPSLDAGRWHPPPSPQLPSGNLRTTHLLEWQLNGGGGPVWRQEASAALRLTAELLEDFGDLSIAVRARAEIHSHHDVNGLFFSSSTQARLTTDTPSRPVVATLTTAVSRGASCELGDTPVTPCPLTDGRLESHLLTRAGQQPLRALVLQWSQVRNVSTLVIRGLERGGGDLRIELGSSGAEWTTVATLAALSDEPAEILRRNLASPGEWRVVELGGLPADRLRLTTSTAFYRARELSVFE